MNHYRSRGITAIKGVMNVSSPWETILLRERLSTEFSASGGRPLVRSGNRGRN